ncbi:MULTISPECIES: aminotransferase class V-fold PLP-dependent enzyme [Paenibacillus]|uniref:aminotransferase class V-fold PLP-dependent enzyme n=1 Tax=Paenibacillus TaxID=44249 RepID=UPI0022B88AC9|nr:aminotransferase class V-fold PLP-dependent enzyme [Paenibacillus caseinilyticus]MCZ8524086.1 aminotransferase class V-fold PLP-dependent enzyme [Paenibacillus caseinilyticus]
MDTIYLDHAASSWPKPPGVIGAIQDCIANYAANPGRGSHAMAVKASRTLFEGRKRLSKLFGIRNPNDISYALNTTMALNQAIQGFVREGEHVICTSVEHNSVRRPLEYMKRKYGVSISYVETDALGYLSMDKIRDAVTSQTRLIVCNHSSNLLGSILPIAEIGQLCEDKGITLLVDAAQTAGVLPIDVGSMGIHMMAFPGHKSLLGPQGTGGLYIHPKLDLEPLLHGGTGSQSEAIEQPSVRPDRYEAGTQNTPGIAGWVEGLKYIEEQTVEAIYAHEWKLTQRIMEGLMPIQGIGILGPRMGEERTGIVSFTLANADSSEIAFILDQSFHIAVRAGFHCTPLAHEVAGTTQGGAVRASVGCFTTEEEVDRFIAAVGEIAKHIGSQ